MDSGATAPWRRQGSQQGSSVPAPSIESSDNSTTTPSTVSTAPIATGGMPPPPPPPPFIPSGAIPAVRLNSEVGLRDKGPPMALANAMMKDKKPFTYTPGGIDLSEIRSPRMAKRIQMNAAAEGVTSAPENRPAPGPPPGGPGYLPPAAFAAMQPQMAIPVFPQGGFNPANLNKTQKPSDFIPPPPPGPPPFMQQLQQNFTNQNRQPNSPPPPSGPPPFMQQLQQNFSNQNRQESPPPPRTPPPPPIRSSTPTTVPVQFESRPISNKATDNGYSDSVDNRVSPVPFVGVGQGCIYIPAIEKSKPASPPPASVQKSIQTKAQAHSQNLGSIYIPPIEQRANERSPGTAGSSSNNIAASDSSAVRNVASPPQSLPSTPMTPLLNKAPTPWMNSYNRMQNQPPTTPPYVNPANIATPWGVAGTVRNIPISMADEDNSQTNANVGGVRSVSGPSNNNARVIPIQIQREDIQPQYQQQQHAARNIPIQMESDSRRPPAKSNQTPSTPGTPQPGPPGYQKRIVPGAYNNPMGLYSNQNAAEAYHKQAGELYGMDRMSIADDNRRTEPIQSKSLRVIQKVAEDDLLRHEMQQQENRRLELMGDDKQLMDLFKAQVDEGSSSYQSEEPRFRGGHIPSRAFRTLQSNLPASPGVQDQSPNFQTQAQNAKGQLTHNIQILMQSQPQSPTPQHQQVYQHQIQMQPDMSGAGGSQGKVPPSQQKVQEPKKYMGSNIPSRSFKILQAMTADEDSMASESEAAPEDQNSYSSDENSDTNPYPFPYPYALYTNDQVSNSVQGQGEYPQQWSENCEGDPNWDPYTYMSWYYWWYYTSCYWNGYDMTGYEYPQNWDPNYFPEGYSSDYSGCETSPESYNQAQMDNVHIPSKSFKNLQRSCNPEDEDVPTAPDVPKIIIESETCPPQSEVKTENKYLMKPDSSNVKLNDCDSKKNVIESNQSQQVEDDSSSDDDNDDDYESCVEEQMVIKSETVSECNRGTETNQQNNEESEDDEDDEETEPEDDDGDEGIVEEPETPSSEDSDAATLVDEICYDRYSRVGGLTIEEYQSPNSDSCDSFFDLGKKNRLSTIDELTENERSRASSVMPINLSQEFEFDRQPLKEECEDEEDDEDSETDSDDLSSVSVIENKSDAQGEATTATESKREDETTSSEEDEVEEEYNEDDVAAVTVRLPLKLSFTKSKSYRDIATVLVCDSEVCSGEEANEETRVGQIMEVKETTDFDDKDGNEPAVSFTISLSRSTSKNKDEDVIKNNAVVDSLESREESRNDSVVEEQPDIDFWSQIENTEVEKSHDFWKTKKTSEEKSNDFSNTNPATGYEHIQDFWGALNKEKSKLEESIKDVDFCGSIKEKEDIPCESEESKTEEILDFWGEIIGSKSEEIVKENRLHETNETKKSVSWDRKDSIDYKWDNEFNFWDKSVKSVETRRFSHNFEISEAYESDSGLKSESRRKKVDRLHHKRHSIHGSIWNTIRQAKDQDQGESHRELETDKEQEIKTEEDQSPWAYWDNLEKSRNENKNSNKKEEESESSSDDDDDDHVGNGYNVDVSAEVQHEKESDVESEVEEDESEEIENVSEDRTKCNGTDSSSTTECRNTIKDLGSHSESEATQATSYRLSPALPISDENSDESSSKSSATTIGRDKSDLEKTDLTEKVEATIPNGNHMVVAAGNTSKCIEKMETPRMETEAIRRQVERPIEIRELREKIKLSPSKDLDGHQEEACTCHLADRMARAEGLLWRIERFLQESLSLGSEDDSGVMTDLSRQISDVDTDADNDINDNEFLLTAALAAKQKRSGSRNNVNNSATNNTNTHQPNCTHNQTQTQVKKRPTSEILLESHSKTETEIETDTVKMRSASERKALRYQRAKTHSRLFQLLQVECSKEDEDDDYEEMASENDATETNIPIETEQVTTKETTVPSSSTEERRSRLVPLPIKNFLTSSLSCDSNSSPSGSSGVLSPTSPVNRDQLLADIINEFHLRHQQQNQKRLSNFPSKIFKLLQQEFGEEFYQTFDCCTDDSGFHIPVSVEGDKNCQGGSLVQECTIHKSESLKLLEEAAALRSSGSNLNNKDKPANHCRKSTTAAKTKNFTSSNHKTTTATASLTESTEILTVTSGTATTKDSKFLEVPLRRKKANMNRDPRSPRTKKS